MPTRQLDRVWPSSAQLEEQLTIAGVPATELATRFGTPLVVVDEAEFRARCRAYTAAFPLVSYASKAFLCTSVVRWVEEEGLGLDVCTGGELAVALRAGFPSDRITLHGSNRSDEELEAALDAGVGRVVVDGLTDIPRVAAVAARRGRVQAVLLRIAVGVTAHAHSYVATAHEDQQFGVQLDQAMEAVGAVLGEPNLTLLGLHSHIGSQILDLAGFEVAARRMVDLIDATRSQFGVRVGELNLGGGLGIPYVEGECPPSPARLGGRLHQLVEDECGERGLSPPRLAVEPGRSVVGPAGVTLYRVGTIKPLKHRTYVAVDGGMSDNIRPALYQARYTAALVGRRSAAPPMLVRVVGRHCETGDVVVPDGWLPSDLRRDDLLGVAGTGAYCHSMASNYNHVPRPAVVAVRDGNATIIVRREDEGDLMARDGGFDAGVAAVSWSVVG